MAFEKLQARGVIFTCCNVALTVLSGMAAGAAGLPKDTAKQDWLAGMFKGVNVVPSGVLAVNRAQKKGCTYCYAG
jgi:intracellular sulfur oxidation DsrE/DsrF family protein